MNKQYYEFLEHMSIIYTPIHLMFSTAMMILIYYINGWIIGTLCLSIYLFITYAHQKTNKHRLHAKIPPPAQCNCPKCTQ